MRRLLRRPFLLGAAVVLLGVAAATGGIAAARHAGALSHGRPADVPKLTLLSSVPSTGSTSVPPDSELTVIFDQPLAASTPMPTLDPAVAGTWVENSSNTVQFDPTASLPPGAQETIEVPGGDSGMAGADGSRLKDSLSIPFTVAPMSALRTQELLAQLDYLPLTFAPTTPAPPPSEMAMDQPGNFTWRWTTMPSNFTALWQAGQANAITDGAVMAFEAQENLTTDGVAGPQVWSALLAAVAADQTDTNPDYDWVDVSTSLPESLTVWRNGAPLYSTPVNTGVEGAATAEGTWPVYARYVSTTMKGTNPDGTPYDDPGVPWVSYFHGGDALHGFIRASYGFPQSLGCVEMPPANAAVVFPMTPLGTLVTVA